MKKIVAVSIILSMLAAFALGISAEAPENAAEPITVSVDGEGVVFDTEPVIRENRVMVPMRAIFEKLNADVEWHAGEKTVMATKIFGADSFGIIFIQIDNPVMLMGYKADNSDEITEKKTELECPPIIINSRTLVPLRAISEALGCDVSWDEETRSVTIKSDKKEEEAKVEDYVSKIMSELPDNVNYVISPYSLKMAMMMAANGAQNNTLDQIASAFNENDIDAFNSSAKELIESLNSGDNGEISIANSIWFNKDYYNDSKVDFQKSSKA